MQLFFTAFSVSKQLFNHFLPVVCFNKVHGASLLTVFCDCLVSVQVFQFLLSPNRLKLNREKLLNMFFTQSMEFSMGYFIVDVTTINFNKDTFQKVWTILSRKKFKGALKLLQIRLLMRQSKCCNVLLNCMSLTSHQLIVREEFQSIQDRF